MSRIGATRPFALRKTWVAFGRHDVRFQEAPKLISTTDIEGALQPVALGP